MFAAATSTKPSGGGFPDDPASVQRQAGFTLIETIIAMFILTVALLALGQLIGVAINQNAMSRSVSVGITVAQGQLELLRSAYNRQLETGVAQSNLATGSHGPETVSLRSNVDGQPRQFAVSWQVTSPTASSRTIQVTARPLNAFFMNSRSVSITSHFAP
jgi:prepilin-type N-terminal cleavage/methylation domain-containing protein